MFKRGIREVPLENDDPKQDRQDADSQKRETLIDADEAAERLLQEEKQKTKNEKLQSPAGRESLSVDDVAKIRLAQEHERQTKLAQLKREIIGTPDAEEIADQLDRENS